MSDVLVWLIEQRDHHAKLRDKAFRHDDWATGNGHDDLCSRFYAAIKEITEARTRLGVFSDVLQKRIIVAHAEHTKKCTVGQNSNTTGGSDAG